MLVVSDLAKENLQKVLESDQAKGKNLIIFFQGHG